MIKLLLKPDQIAFIVMIVLALVGVGITDYSPADSHPYWVAMIGVFACAALFVGWKRAREKGEEAKGVLLKQLLHWGAALLAVGAAYTLYQTGRLENEDAGLVVLLTLALATFLDGIHLGWRFFVAGSLLFITVVMAAYLEEFIWFILLITIPVVALILFWERIRPAKGA